MLLLGALFAVFILGFWLYCLVDVALTPSNECHGLPKVGWIALVAGTFVVGAVVWLAVRRPAQPAVASLSPGPARAEGDGGHPGNERPRPADEPGAEGRPGPEVPGPSGTMTPVGPDDDPEFLRSLDRAIHGADAGDEPGG
jgi:hypothetical protein